MSDSKHLPTLTRRRFLATSGLAVGGVIVGCGGRRRGAPDGSDAGTDSDGTDVLTSDVAPDYVEAPIGHSAASDVFRPELSAPPSSNGYSDGNVIVHRFPRPNGGTATIWVGAEGRQLHLTVGSPASDGVLLAQPRDADVTTDLAQFRSGRLHYEIQTLLGDSVLSDALARSRAV